MTKQSICVLCLVLSVAFQSCALSKKNQCGKKIVYHVFDSLENYMSDRLSEINLEKGHHIFFSIESAEEQYRKPFGRASHAVYSIEAYNSGENVPDGFAEMSKKSNRYMEINGKLYPVIFRYFDDFFTDPVTEASLIGYYKYDRQIFLSFSKIHIIVDLNKSIFYDSYDMTKMMGRQFDKVDSLNRR